MKSIINLCLAILLLVVTNLEASHHRHHHCSHRKKDHGKDHVHIEVFYPKGLAVWYPKQPEMEGFGIAIYLNQKHNPDEAKCDLCLNTTEVTYGKFMIRNDDAVIRAGDHLKYQISKLMLNGSVVASKSNEFYVADYRMLPLLEPCPPSVPTSVLNKHQSSIAKLEAEINLLEVVMLEVIQRCGNVNQTSKNLFLQSPPDKPLLDSKALYNRTLQVLKRMLPNIDWEKKLLHAFYYEDGIGFEVKTMADKLVILHTTKNSVPLLAIRDMDKTGLLDNEVGSWEGSTHSAVDIRMAD